MQRTELLTPVRHTFSHEANPSQNAAHGLTIKPLNSCFGSRWVIVRHRGISFWLAGFFVDVEVYHGLPGPLVHLAGHQNVIASHTALCAEWGFSSLFRLHLRQRAS